MSLALGALLATASLALTACNQTPVSAGTGQTADTGCSSERPSGALYDANLGDPCDPGSIAYFNRTYGNMVTFMADQSALTAEGRSILIGQAQWLVANPNYAAVVEGHANEEGASDYNFELGERRAATVQDFLVSHGVPAKRLRILSYGNERPLEMCSSDACYANNRRAVTVLSAGAGI